MSTWIFTLSEALTAGSMPMSTKVFQANPSVCNNPGQSIDIVCFKDFTDAFKKICPSIATKANKIRELLTYYTAEN